MPTYFAKIQAELSYQISLNDKISVGAQGLRPDKFIITNQADLVSLAVFFLRLTLIIYAE